MGIRTRNQQEFLVDLSIPGGQSATTSRAIFVAPFKCWVKRVGVQLGVAGTTSSQITDIHKATADGVGTTIFSAAPKITVATGANDATFSALTSDPVVLLAGEKLIVDIDSVHTTPGANLALYAVISKKAVSGTVFGTVAAIGANE